MNITVALNDLRKMQITQAFNNIIIRCNIADYAIGKSGDMCMLDFREHFHLFCVEQATQIILEGLMSISTQKTTDHPCVLITRNHAGLESDEQLIGVQINKVIISFDLITYIICKAERIDLSANKLTIVLIPTSKGNINDTYINYELMPSNVFSY